MASSSNNGWRGVVRKSLSKISPEIPEAKGAIFLVPLPVTVLLDLPPSYKHATKDAPPPYSDAGDEQAIGQTNLLAPDVTNTRSTSTPNASTTIPEPAPLNQRSNSTPRASVEGYPSGSWYKRRQRYMNSTHYMRKFHGETTVQTINVPMTMDEYMLYFAQDRYTLEYMDGVEEPEEGRKTWIQQRLRDRASG